MNITQKYEEKNRTEQKQKEIERQQKVKDLANKIITTLRDKETIESIENYLIENGFVAIKDFGCLCQGGFCTWQDGLEGLLQPLIKEWDAKGVSVSPSLSLHFAVKSNTRSFELFISDGKTTEQIKNWNKTRK